MVGGGKSLNSVSASKWSHDVNRPHSLSHNDQFLPVLKLPVHYCPRLQRTEGMSGWRGTGLLLALAHFPAEPSFSHIPPGEGEPEAEACKRPARQALPLPHQVCHHSGRLHCCGLV